MNKDYVGDFILLKGNAKALEEQISALETIIVTECRDDERIQIIKRRTIVIQEATYEKLESVGIATKITETRPKKLDEFDKDVQNLIMKNPENYEEKFSKEFIKIK